MFAYLLGLAHKCARKVEADLDPAALEQVLKLCLKIRAGAVKPVRVEDGDTGEYTEGRFSLLIPLDANWEK